MTPSLSASEIAQVDGVDVLFVGPADLQVDLQARPEKAVRDFTACLAHVAAVAGAAGKLCGLLLRDRADLPRMLELGFTHLAIDSDLGLLRAGYQNILAKLHDDPCPPLPRHLFTRTQCAPRRR